MKKIQLKRVTDVEPRKRIGYKIAYNNELNPAQYDAVMHNNGAALVIAGAGTGKTRTLVYRLSRLVEDGVQPDSILLLTFTRKASAEMLRRASTLLDGRCERVSGGTFHSFSLNILRRYSKILGMDGNFNVLDQGDSEDTINLLRTQMRFDKSKKRFPKKETLLKIFNLSVNRCLNIEDVILKDFPFFFEELDNINQIFQAYKSYKLKYNILDYDDLLLYLYKLLNEFHDTKKEINRKYTYLMVDEYQDTNKLQHEIVKHLAGPNENVMAVGDDAQSIYSFRGAEFKNIIDFPFSFKDCKIYKIEENYRSTQEILTLTNEIIKSAPFQYQKELFSRKSAIEKPKIITSENERQQSLFLVQEILELREQQIPLEEMAILFRSAFLSFDLEIELNKANIPYKKFGGMKFVETAHIKDMTSFFKILSNPRDAVSWNRALLLLDGVGPRTSTRIIEQIAEKGVDITKSPDLTWIPKGRDSINSMFIFINEISTGKINIGERANLIAEFYKPLLQNKYDDWQKRWKDIEMFITIAERYKSTNEFLNDMAIKPPIESVIDIEEESKEDEYLTLTTIHSAKGLEWKAVFLIWILDGRFPSSKAADSIDSIEEERRLFYVACTRAKDYLYLTYPTNIYDREQGIVLSKPTRFLDGINEGFAERFVLQDFEESEN
ncbi:MAG: ATP-dependent DNA helicase [Ignavibacteria bacterium GWB2_35_12]|nr:MAG: ATP-dependent DNA helicase [Ignavibacteria bacterium GWA2_35_8]OGU38258.1 MAG: ATP-dependent DNA helicase [Ignavibacteria bacterium GWB2_35_12]OGU95479.1 MAG: ATP-dependent DNA helicase [Ignavibacteria bacterium RIFOXYA2_FULL_35_10]OGV20804.1 MAG: ATP-dependent DNA helicase [Ignavibacteria bacterium RIFOXYC2_FULL_35_21]